MRVERRVCWGWGVSRRERLQLWRMGEHGLMAVLRKQGECTRGRKWDGVLTCGGVSACVMVYPWGGDRKLNAPRESRGSQQGPASC